MIISVLGGRDEQADPYHREGGLVIKDLDHHVVTVRLGGAEGGGASSR